MRQAPPQPSPMRDRPGMRIAHSHAFWNTARQESPFIRPFRVPKLAPSIWRPAAGTPNRNETV
ncbi:hypothetical protein BURCENBC7_AP4150 [Burkholderia cenocepacia BC7]|nr:hypothetical protein BURCENK562V_C5244 [Burkholderia cenocepacia K56-2Valvano]ERI24732.1 hypothetical protein BURCENBC7_AP4150 [Burkholderia cenocepacia BC7]